VYPQAPLLFPNAPDARRTTMEIVALTDGALNTIVDVGTRYFPLNTDDAWKAVTTEMLGRAQAALTTLAERVSRSGVGPLTKAGWCAADIWLFSMVAWIEGLPARASSSANITQILSLPWSLPTPLSRWADGHRDRPDVRALG
jgi:hypothetical protein